MPKLYEYEISVQPKVLRLVVPDDLPEGEIARLVHEKASEMVKRYFPTVQLKCEVKSLTIAEASADPADRISDNRNYITDSEVRWLGEGEH